MYKLFHVASFAMALLMVIHIRAIDQPIASKFEVQSNVFRSGSCGSSVQLFLQNTRCIYLSPSSSMTCIRQEHQMTQRKNVYNNTKHNFLVYSNTCVDDRPSTTTKPIGGYAPAIGSVRVGWCGRFDKRRECVLQMSQYSTIFLSVECNRLHGRYFTLMSMIFSI
jgi:hypothetical protein